MVRRLALLACTTLLIGAASPPSRTFVVRAVGPDAKAWPKGKLLANGTRIALKSGSIVQTLDREGTRTLRGPGQFIIGGESVATSRTEALVTGLSTTERRNRAAAVTMSELLSRGRKVRLYLRNPGARNTRGFGAGGTIRFRQWQDLAIGQSGPFCMVGQRPLSLWRTQADAPEAFDLHVRPRSDSVRADLAVGDYRHSVFISSSSGTPRKISYALPDGSNIAVKVVKLAEGDTADVTRLYDTLTRKKCTQQADALIAELALMERTDPGQEQ